MALISQYTTNTFPSVLWKEGQYCLEDTLDAPISSYPHTNWKTVRVLCLRSSAVLKQRAWLYPYFLKHHFEENDKTNHHWEEKLFEGVLQYGLDPDRFSPPLSPYSFRLQVVHEAVNTALYSHTSEKHSEFSMRIKSAGSIRGSTVSFKTYSCSVTLCFVTDKFSYSAVYWNGKSYSPVACAEESGKAFKSIYFLKKKKAELPFCFWLQNTIYICGTLATVNTTGFLLHRKADSQKENLGQLTDLCHFNTARHKLWQPAGLNPCITQAVEPDLPFLWDPSFLSGLQHMFFKNLAVI